MEIEAYVYSMPSTCMVVHEIAMKTKYIVTISQLICTVALASICMCVAKPLHDTTCHWRSVAEQIGPILCSATE